jgi:hypothetical protein
MTGTAIDSPLSPAGLMAFILYSRVALPTGDFIAMSRCRKRLDVYAAAASFAARFVAIHTLLLGIGAEITGGEHDHEADQAQPDIPIAIQ